MGTLKEIFKRQGLIRALTSSFVTIQRKKVAPDTFLFVATMLHTKTSRPWENLTNESMLSKRGIRQHIPRKGYGLQSNSKLYAHPEHISAMLVKH
jgi:hypothetical protein